jgi:hypothetical protein
MDANQLLFSLVAGMGGMFVIAVFGLIMGASVEQCVGRAKMRGLNWTANDELRYRASAGERENYLS